MKKNYVLDTNVLLHDPRAIFRFDDNNVIIPIHVLEEIDQFKKELSELGRNARLVSRYMDRLRTNGGKLAEGCALESGGTLRVAMGESSPIDVQRGSAIMDSRILAVALKVKADAPELNTIFVTQDVNLRVRADVLGLTAEDFEADKISIDELYPGCSELDVSVEDVDRFFADGEIAAPQVELEGGRPIYPNEYVMIRADSNPSHTALSRFDDASGTLKAVRRLKKGTWGIRPRNKEQQYALDLLLNDDIKLVTLVGKAGTGKTLLAIAAGLQRTVEDKTYQKLLVSRPIFPLGRDLGYLPGDLEDKLNPWMQPIYDNIELLMGIGREDRHKGRGHEELLDMGYVEIEPLTYIRGRSIPNQFILVDEAQNLTPHEVKTILTRVGDNTKIVLTGDAYQIDNPYVDSSNNGLTYVVERFKEQAMAGHITLQKGERSALAEIAANLL
ncbi:MAG: PhoH family protein [bacterium]